MQSSGQLYIKKKMVMFEKGRSVTNATKKSELTKVLNFKPQLDMCENLKVNMKEN